MTGTVARVAWALGALGLEPASKLVLVLAANAADMDGRAWKLTELRDLANLTDDGFRAAVDELATVGLAGLTPGVHPTSGEKRPCLQLFIDGDAA
jgi:hypothetical protein